MSAGYKVVQPDYMEKRRTKLISIINAMEISALRLYQIIAEKSDHKTASEVVTAVQETIKEEVKKEATSQINAMKGELIDRINVINDRISTTKQELSDQPPFPPVCF
jgi:hypothetical protein